VGKYGRSNRKREGNPFDPLNRDCGGRRGSLSPTVIEFENTSVPCPVTSLIIITNCTLLSQRNYAIETRQIHDDIICFCIQSVIKPMVPTEFQTHGDRPTPLFIDIADGRDGNNAKITNCSASATPDGNVLPRDGKGSTLSLMKPSCSGWCLSQGRRRPVGAAPKCTMAKQSRRVYLFSNTTVVLLDCSHDCSSL